MVDEFNALATNDAWILVPRHLDMNVVGCKWVSQVKQTADGSLDKYKARLVAKSYNQQEGIDFFEALCPEVQHATIRLLLKHALTQNWLIKQLDVKNTFLNGFLAEEVYMLQLASFKDPTHPDHVCLLIKALYDLKQALRAWF